jgi:membrane dipeptidase
VGQIDPGVPATAAQVARLFADSLVWDNHACSTLRVGHAHWLSHLKRHHAAGVDVVCMNVGFDAAPATDAVLLLSEFRSWLRAHPEKLTLIERVEDIDRSRREGKLGVCFNLEGGCALFGNTNMVSLYYDLGVRWMLFAYNRNNTLAGGCQDDDGGLTEFGRAVLEEMERVGMVVCCSHIGRRSAMEILERATRPVIFSHSNPRAIWDHPRNIDDDAIRACAKIGGVIGINGIGIFLGENDIRTELIVRHIGYVANLVGAEHVGIGLDYCYDQEEVHEFVRAHPATYPPEKYPSGLLSMEPERFPEIAEQLLKTGFSEDDVRNILGGNHLRVAREVWK